MEQQQISKSKPLSVLFVGPTRNIHFYWDWIRQNMVILKGENQDAVLEGQLNLGNSLFEVCFAKTTDESVIAQDPQVDGLLIDGENRLKNYYCLNKRYIKMIGFLDATKLHGIFYFFGRTWGDEKLACKMRDFLKVLQTVKIVKPIAPKYFHEEGQAEASSFHEERQRKLGFSELGFNKNEEDLRTDLTKFLTLKYYYQGKELQEKIEDASWSSKFQDWDALRRILNSVATPDWHDLNKGPAKKRPIRVILPKDIKDVERSFNLLKAAAYLPFQLALGNSYEGSYCLDINMMFQLAMATHYGRWDARYSLYLTKLDFPLLDEKHPIVANFWPDIHEDDYYFELPFPFEDTTLEDDYPKIKIDFNPEKDETRTREFYNYLLEVAKTGQRPDKQAFLVNPKHW